MKKRERDREIIKARVQGASPHEIARAEVFDCKGDPSNRSLRRRRE
jgi:hypothetical protein